MAGPVIAGQDDPVRFGVLGPLQVVDGAGIAWQVRAAKQRVLLATLLLGGGATISAASMSEALWDVSPPPNAPVVMRTYVMRLRRALGPVGARVVSRPPGWAIVLRGPQECDLTEVEQLRRAAQAAAETRHWARASALLAEALRYWRGEPLTDVPSVVLTRRDAARLSELRLQLTEARIGADLQLGRHAELVMELRQLASEHPLREHLRALLMLACYRSGQQAAALESYRDAHRILAEELGVAPGPELQQMHQRILAADPDLGARPPGEAAILHPGPGMTAAPPVPRQLPPAPSVFTGRAAELSLLWQLPDEAAGTVGIAVVGGTAGVGKTALAVHWAHQAAGRFPDGQLYVNLRGFDPSGIPAAPEAAIRGFLDALGVPPERIPPDPDARAGLYRTLLADRTMLIVLDNARDEAQVRPLLPASPSSVVLVTSRGQLSGLAVDYGARLLSLDVLTHDEAVQLLAVRLGAGRIAAEPAAAAEIARLCACLPLALAVAAALAAVQPGFPLAVLVGELGDAAGRLDALDAGDPAASVRAVFSWSYQQLSTDAARMFRLLGVHPGPDISALAAASLAGARQTQARRVLRELAWAHLITEHAPGRYVFHDLLRAYAGAVARDTGSESERAAAVGRILDHYLHTASQAALLLVPVRDLIALAPPSPGAVPEQPADHAQALAWFEAEHQVLLAAVALAASTGSASHAWQLPWAMEPFLQHRGHYQEWAATQRTALAAATRAGDVAGQAVASCLLASAYDDLHDYDQALGHYTSSLGLYQRLGNRLGQAIVHQNLGLLAEHQGCYADALGHAQQALRLYQAIGHQAGEAVGLNFVGWCHGLLGDYQQARACCRRALAFCAEAGYRRSEGCAWDSLGYAEHHLGNFPQATDCYERALAIARELGDRWVEADTLTHLADTRHAAGDRPQARQAWQEALAILDDIQHPDAARVRAKLSGPDARRPR